MDVNFRGIPELLTYLLDELLNHMSFSMLMLL